MRILLIEDEQNLRKIIQLNLEMENFEVISVDNGANALEKLKTEYFDLIILDLMLPHVNGMDVLRRFRLQNNTTPIIITSAKDTSGDRIAGLKEGADDYLSKPFDIEELILRIEKLLQRNAPSELTSEHQSEDVYTFGNNSVDFKKFIGTHKNEEFNLRPKELHLLKLLITRKNEVISRQDILKSVWGYDVFPSTRTVDNFIASLRKYFEEDPRNPRHIQSVRGVGYRFVD